MRLAVVDIGSNSTRLLIADVEGRDLVEISRRSEVTRLGAGVDAAGRLAGESMERVFRVLDEYDAEIDGARCEARVAVLTSAVRDATNGVDFTEQVRHRYGLDARTIEGDEEARLTFLGAASERPAGGSPIVVIDIGGGSTELVVGTPPDAMSFHVSTQAGVVRQTERHLSEPPNAPELEALAEEVRAIVSSAVPADVRRQASAAVAVAGTATSCAAIDQELDPYDASRVHGYNLPLDHLDRMRERLAAMPLAQRRQIKGLHPDRAPTIVAGVMILQEALKAFGLDETEISEHDILRGVALQYAAERIAQST